ncbi:Aste57867_4297 [Aphanomyces stellatus]|uniref:Aste57867_4297 protein n=1 Tax=Aphanomyces stellatus TaxID=120398 RepID=A0A485KGM9_9STRA|nr:hypothetical protein As57867_004286 [Aphanomyces stellatus]VFT81412.1 Aste57867_4297 [Aphanomyces stellatus]
MKLKNTKLPFFILDEMSPSTNITGGKNLAAFQRNIFRACGLVVFIMGTDSKVTNLIAQAVGSYAEEHRWMAILPRFPPYQFVLDVVEKQVWDDVNSRYPVIEFIVNQSRGRFARHFTEQVLQIVKKQPNVKLNELLDNAFAAIHKRILFRKKNFDGKYAQLMAISFTNGHQPATKKPRSEVGSSSMHAHFANLVDECLSDIYLSTGRLHKVTQEDMLVPWEVKCCFPPINEDLLLYLSVLGGKSRSAYSEAEVHFSTKYIFTKANVFSVHENSNAPSNDYKSFENMVTHAIFCSSRRHGVQGIPFNDFISCLIGEFQDEVWTKMTLNLGKRKTKKGKRKMRKNIKASDLLEGYSRGVQKLLDNVIPFLAPPNSEWPESILQTNQHGCNVGHLVRAVNSERCNVYVKDLKNQDETALILCECKYWEAGIDIGTMNGIIEGISKQWTWELVVVFCPRVAKFRSEWNYNSIGCVKIDCKNANVEWIFQPQNESSREQLVIVMEIPNCRGLTNNNKIGIITT